MDGICCYMGLCLSKKEEELSESSSLSSLSSLSEIELFSVNANKTKTICEVNDEITIQIIFQDEMKKQNDIIFSF